MGSGRVRCGVRRLLRLPLGPGLVLRDAGLGSCRCCRVSRAVWRPACEAARPRAGRLSPVSTAVTLVSKMTWAGILHFSSRFTRTPATNADSTASIVANLIVIVGMPSCSGRSLSRWQLEPEAARRSSTSHTQYIKSCTDPCPDLSLLRACIVGRPWRTLRPPRLISSMHRSRAGRCPSLIRNTTPSRTSCLHYLFPASRVWSLHVQASCVRRPSKTLAAVPSMSTVALECAWLLRGGEQAWPLAPVVEDAIETPHVPSPARHVSPAPKSAIGRSSGNNQTRRGCKRTAW